jgi:hypothetical protein
MGKQRDLKEIMNARLNEASEELKKSRERNLNTFERNTADNSPEALASSNQPDTWSIDMPNDVKNVGTEVYTAPTKNPKRPRAYTVGYNHNTRTVVIVMRSGAWWQYNDVQVPVWLGLKNSPSTTITYQYLKLPAPHTTQRIWMRCLLVQKSALVIQQLLQDVCKAGTCLLLMKLYLALLSLRTSLEIIRTTIRRKTSLLA